ncbi:MAG: hypothetical protein IJ458_03715 [Clostridia bacterium]|nr:hypothetical protein [Clostridia bacterium]
MEKHSQKFINLQGNFNEIQSYIKGSSIDVDKFAQLFYLELLDINIQWQTYHAKLLDDAELAVVQRWINRIMGNRNINRNIRRKIMEEGFEFNEMVELIYSVFNCCLNNDR